MHDAHGLGALDVVAYFARVDGLHGGEGEGEDAAEDVDEGDRGRGHGFVGGVVHVAGCGAGDDGEAQGHAERGGHEHLAAAEDVVEARPGGREDPAGEGVDGVEEKLRVGVCYADVFDEEGEILLGGVLLAKGGGFVGARREMGYIRMRRCYSRRTGRTRRMRCIVPSDIFEREY